MSALPRNLRRAIAHQAPSAPSRVPGGRPTFRYPGLAHEPPPGDVGATPAPTTVRVRSPLEESLLDASARRAEARKLRRDVLTWAGILSVVTAGFAALLLRSAAGDHGAGAAGARQLAVPERLDVLAAHGATHAARSGPERERPHAPALVRAEAKVEAPSEGLPDDADANVRRDGHGGLKGGVLFVPKSFSSRDGSYDLLIHFHGNTRVVLESVEHADLNALVAVVNLGVGSLPYEEAYAVRGSYEALLDQIGRVAEARGLATPRLRRVALSSWSAGYGALSSILQLRTGRDPLDALLVLDGIHCGYRDGDPRALNALNLEPFVRAARLAADRGILFSITHAEVIPEGYAGSAETADLLLGAVGGVRQPRGAGDAPPHVDLPAARGAVSKKLEKRMEPMTEAAVGGLRVRGYRGETPEHHMAHLFQMGATVLPELAARWSTAQPVEAAEPTAR
jgi:hypothetical protein